MIIQILFNDIKLQQQVTRLCKIGETTEGKPYVY